MAAWHVKNPRVPDDKIQCSLVQRPTVFLYPRVQEKLKLLMEAFPHQEWCGYLQGTKSSNFFWIMDITIPPHEEVSAVHCVAEPFHQPSDTIGFLHSHHQMGAFHSGQDARTVDVNYELSITIAKRAGQDRIEYDPIATAKTLCNHKVLVRTALILLEGSVFIPTGWLDIAKMKINRPLTRRQLIPSIVQIPVPALRITMLIKPVTIDREGNLHDRNGLFVGKNKRIVSPVSRQVYYQDSQGQLFTQQDIDNIKEGKRI